MKINSFGNYLERNPHLSETFGSVEKSHLFHEHQMGNSVITTKRELYNNKNNEEKTAEYKSSGFFNLKNTNNSPSFKGAKYDKFLKSEWLHKLLKFADKNKPVFEAVIAFMAAGVLRPMTIMGLPADEKDKKKNQKTSAHSISSAIIGLASTIILFYPTSKALENFRKHPEKYGLNKTKDAIFDSVKRTVKKVENGVTKVEVNNVGKFGEYTKFMGYVPKILFAPLTTALTIAAIPYVDKHIMSKVFPQMKTTKMSPQDMYTATSFKEGQKSEEMSLQDVYTATSFKEKQKSAEMSLQDVYTATSFKAFRDLQEQNNKKQNANEMTPSQIYMATSFKAKELVKGGNK